MEPFGRRTAPARSPEGSHLVWGAVVLDEGTGPAGFPGLRLGGDLEDGAERPHVGGAVLVIEEVLVALPVLFVGAGVPGEVVKLSGCGVLEEPIPVQDDVQRDIHVPGSPLKRCPFPFPLAANRPSDTVRLSVSCYRSSLLSFLRTLFLPLTDSQLQELRDAASIVARPSLSAICLRYERHGAILSA